MAQQKPQFSHYGFNGMFISPGYSGIKKATEFNMIGRYQWFNYDGAFDDGGSPKTALFNVSIPWRQIKGGIGVNLLTESIGATDVVTGSLSYAYHLELGGGKLGIGGQAIVTNLSKGQYRYMDEGDPNIPFNSSDTKFDLGAGLWYQADKYYIGAGMDNLMASKYQFEAEQTIGSDGKPVKGTASVTGARHLYATAGYDIDASSSVVITPTALFKYDLNEGSQFDIGARGTFNEKYWVGLNYRHQEAVTGMAGISFLKDNSMRLGYAFDLTTFDKDAKAISSHEIMLSYRIPQSPLATKPAIRTPRYSY